MIRGGLEAAGIVTTVEVRGDLEAGLGSGGAGEIEDLLVGDERLTSPISRDLGEEAMLDGIPFGSAGGIVGNRDSESERVGQLRLEFCFPSVTTAAVTATRVGENEKFT